MKEITVEYDLHMHTTASDGIFSPLEVYQKAVSKGLKGIAITDHDTVEGLAELQGKIKAGAVDSLMVIPGIELNTDFNDEEIHILGYFIDTTHEILLEHLKHIKQARYERARLMVEKLQKMGMSVTFTEVEQYARQDLIARPHIAMALMKKGYVSSIKDAFIRFIGKGCPAYVPRYKFTPRQAIDLIKTAGGVSVLAHPGLLKRHASTMDIIACGIEGIEAYYPEHTGVQIEKYLLLAREFNLFITGGSDFHGNGSDGGRSRLGVCGIDEPLMQRIVQYISEKKE